MAIEENWGNNSGQDSSSEDHDNLLDSCECYKLINRCRGSRQIKILKHFHTITENTCSNRTHYCQQSPDYRCFLTDLNSIHNKLQYFQKLYPSHSGLHHLSPPNLFLISIRCDTKRLDAFVSMTAIQIRLFFPKTHFPKKEKNYPHSIAELFFFFPLSSFAVYSPDVFLFVVVCWYHLVISTKLSAERRLGEGWPTKTAPSIMIKKEYPSPSEVGLKQQRHVEQPHHRVLVEDAVDAAFHFHRNVIECLKIVEGSLGAAEHREALKHVHFCQHSRSFVIFN